MDTIDIIHAVWEVNRRHTRCPLTPCLIADTGAGKTYLARSLAGKRPLEILLLQSGLPEDFLGLPKAERGQTVWALPQWARRACERPALVLVDELDKPDRDQRAAALTLLASREIRGRTLHPDTQLICAMQPLADASEWLADSTGRALTARLCYIPIDDTQAYGYVSSQHGMDLSWCVTNENIVVPRLPHPRPRQVDWCLTACATIQDRELLRAVLSGVLTAEYVDRLLETYESAEAVDPKRLVASLMRDRRRLARMTAREVGAILPEVWVFGDVQLLEDASYRVLSELPDEDAIPVLRRLPEGIAQYAVHDEVDIAGNATEEQVGNAMERAVARASIVRYPEHASKVLVLEPAYEREEWSE